MNTSINSAPKTYSLFENLKLGEVFEYDNNMFAKIESVGEYNAVLFPKMMAMKFDNFDRVTILKQTVDAQFEYV